MWVRARRRGYSRGVSEAVTIRAGAAGDYDAVAALQREIQAAHAQAWPRDFVPPSPETLTRATFDAWLGDARRQLLVAARGDEVIGHAWSVAYERPANSVRPAQRILELDQLCVTAAERGRGHGRALLAAVEARGRALGVERLELSVWLFNRDAIAAYERSGFVATWQRMSRPL